DGVRSQLAQVDPNQPIANIRTVDDLVVDSTARPRFTSILVGIFATLALALAAIGIYGVISYSVSQRANEIGIRMALGARPSDVFRLVIGEGLALAVAGIAIGIAASLALTQFMSSQLFGVTATDPATYLSVSGLLALIALAACYTPARRATRVDPMVALRHE
ncbi:MAG TPA: FtsX-like permease family protein, partial [Blastocatellia bacterium]|nr:FtsX-like permease family protein [Blastocatellia bacterium]